MAMWLESIGYARMEVQRDAEQAMEHLLQAVKGPCSEGYTERATRIVEKK